MMKLLDTEVRRDSKERREIWQMVMTANNFSFDNKIVDCDLYSLHRIFTGSVFLFAAEEVDIISKSQRVALSAFLNSYFVKKNSR